MTASHHAIISALSTFYTLLIDLRYFPASTLVLPSSQTGRHPRNSINNRAATLNGFSDAAIDLAYQIPYLTDEDIRLHYDTNAHCYLAHMPDTAAWGDEVEPEEGEGDDQWSFARDPTYQERDDLWMGRNVLVLTRGLLYGFELIYDLDSRK